MTSTTSLSTATSRDSDFARYGTGAIAFHWSMAILIAVLGIQGYLIDDMARASKDWWINLHVVVGMLTAALLVARIVWRLGHQPPELPEQMTAFIRMLAHGVHMLLYAMTLFVVAVGIGNIVSRGHVIDFGFFQIPPLMSADRAIIRPFDRMHTYSAYLLIALAGAHMLEALWHHFIAGDTILLRMWPNRRR